jgi:hypothetical protein
MSQGACSLPLCYTDALLQLLVPDKSSEFIWLLSRRLADSCAPQRSEVAHVVTPPRLITYDS